MAKKEGKRHPGVFIGYSHNDAEWMGRIVQHLGVLKKQGMLCVWDDTKINAGGAWLDEITKALDLAGVAILLISADFLASGFMLEKEVSRLLERRRKEGVCVIPLIVKPCEWRRIGWLEQMQARPKDGRSLSVSTEEQIDKDLAALAVEVLKLVSRAGKSPVIQIEDGVIIVDGTRITARPSIEALGTEKPLPSLPPLTGGGGLGTGKPLPPLHPMTGGGPFGTEKPLPKVTRAIKKILKFKQMPKEELAPPPSEEIIAKGMEMPSLPETHDFDMESLPLEETYAEPMEPPPAQKESELRQLQAQVYDDNSKQKVTYFKLGSPYLVEIRIGIEDPNWLSSDVSIDLKLPPSPTGHDLTIVFSEPNHHPEPSIGRIHLPPEGNSTICNFLFRTRPEVNDKFRKVSARILVLFKNRVLSSLLLEGDIVLVPTSDSVIKFHPEIKVNPLYSSLDKQKPFDGAIVINRTTAGASQALTFAGDKAGLVSLENIETLVKMIDKKFAECDWTTPGYQSLESAGTVGLLYFLARHGSLLYETVVNQFKDQTLSQAKRLQVIAARSGARLPVEFFYDSPSPLTAKLCPNYKEALEFGKCEDCPGKSEDSICLLSFWGLSRVVEWHKFNPDIKEALTSSDFAFYQQLDSFEGQLSPFSSAVLFGASERVDEVDKDSSKRVETELGKITTTKAFTAGNWAEWTANIEANSPSLLMLIPHTDKDDIGIPTLQIGNDQISLDHINATYVHAANLSTPPVVFLLGCNTGDPDIAFEGAVDKFQMYDASIIVSAITGVLGRHASIIAVEFLKKMEEFSKSSSYTFGEVVLSARRELLLQGVPVVLAVVSYGDADWLLKG